MLQYPLRWSPCLWSFSVQSTFILWPIYCGLLTPRSRPLSVFMISPAAPSVTLLHPSVLPLFPFQESSSFSRIQPLFIPQTHHVLSHVFTSICALPYFWHDLHPLLIQQTLIQSLKPSSDSPFCRVLSSAPLGSECFLLCSPMPPCLWLFCGTGHVALWPSVVVHVTGHAEGRPPSDRPPAWRNI